MNCDRTMRMGFAHSAATPWPAIVLMIVGTLLLVPLSPAGAGLPLESPSATAQETVPPKEPTPKLLQQQRETVTAHRKQVKSLLDQAATRQLSATQRERMRKELDRLTYLELVLMQHREELLQTAQLQTALRESESRLHQVQIAGPDKPPPYSILVQDDIQDELASAETRSRTLQLELTAARDLQQSVIKMLAEAEKARRKIKEQIEVGRYKDKSSDLAEQLEAAKLRSRLLTEVIKFRRAEIKNKTLRHETSKVQVAISKETLKWISRKVVFTPQHLQEVFSELNNVEKELQTRLQDLQVRLQEVEQRRCDAESKTEKKEPNVDKEMQEGWRVAKLACQKEINMIQLRLRELVLARSAWNMRYKIFNHEASADETLSWQEDANTYYEKVKVSRQLLENHAKDLMARLGTLEKQLRLIRRDSPEAAKWIEFQIASWHQLSDAYAMNIVRVEITERMLAKLNARLTTDTRPNTLHAWLGSANRSVEAAWNYEITSLDDHPITVRKVVTGILLMLFGLWLSRFLSRIVGRRMLPRIGMNQGAATAVQSIVFYLLLTVFAFFSLELIHVPLTIFTFFGGAVAIGVGFGSQNILNNFISGLILLAEQPIRVGDLVDMEGVCGTVEKIGARSTRVKTNRNVEMIVPNSKFLEDNVTNWTLSDTRIRTSVSVGVAYGSPTQEVSDLLRQAVLESPNTEDSPAPIVLFKDFGDNSLAFEVHFWIYMRTLMQSQQIESEVRHRIDHLLEQAGITIAFPQRDVHIDSLTPIEVNVRQISADSSLPRRRPAA